MKQTAFLVLWFAATLIPRPGLSANVTSTADSGPGSLRAAIASAAPGDTISFSVTGTISLTSGELSITNPLTIAGPGPDQLTVQRSSDAGTPAFRLFAVDGAAASLSGFTLGNGRLGGIFENGGAILNSGTLSVSNCVFQSNSTVGEYGRGAAIYNDFGARLEVSLCRFIGNEATGVYGDGGAVYVFGSATIDTSSFIDNAVADRGGGIYVDYFGEATINQCAFSDNQASGGSGQGGGLYNIGDTAITNCTFSGNSATNGGGAIYNDALSRSLTIGSCTISGNSAPDGGGLVNAAALPLASGMIDLDNTIVAGNSGGVEIQNQGVITSAGHNLIGATSGNAIAPQPGDQSGVTVATLNLGPLADNGGPTPTRALLGGSIAIDAGDDANCPATDQRGVARPRGAHCDVGAFELNNSAPTITCPAPATLECNSPSGQAVTLTVTVSDADGDALVVIWTVDGTPYQTNIVAASGSSLSVGVDFTAIFGLGNHDVTVSVSDGKAAPVVCTTTLNVRDLVPPTIQRLTAVPNLLWPPNHKLVPVTLRVSATDNCGPVSCKIRSVTSNQSGGGKGRPGQSPDWIITGDLSLELRAESSAGGAGRVYTITVECRDAAGNVSTKAVNVAVAGK